jgi:glycosyltransferase involved in cell wall biosynthesis
VVLPRVRICQVIPHYIPAYRYGGPQRVAHALARALVQAGHEVHVCTTNLADETDDLSVPLDEPVDLDGVVIYYEPAIISRYWGFSPRLWRRVASEVVDADVVFVHAHDQFANWAGAWLARRAGKSYVIFAHGSLHQQGIAHKSSLRKRLYLRLLEHKNLKNALFVAFNAPEERVSSLYGERGRVVPSGIDPAEFTELPRPGSFRERHPQLLGRVCFLFLGRLDVQHKGLDLLMPAFARLVEEYPEIHLVLVGPDEDEGAAQIHALAKRLGIESAVTLTGLLSGSDKLAALQDADVFVLPSRFEGLSIALLEALYMGLPVLVTDQVGLCQEIEHRGAGLVVAANTRAIYDGLHKLVDLGFRTTMRGRGTDLILRKYTWDSIAQNLMAQIEEALA